MTNAQTMKRKPQAVDKAAKPVAEKPVARAADNKVPGYLQAKMNVSQPGDAHERQADQVAERVSRAAKPDTPVTGADKAIQRATLQPGEDLGDRQTTLSRKPDPAKPESTLSKKPQDNPAQKADPQSLQAKGDAPQIDQATEERINSLRGNGEPLPEATKNEMQQQLQADFSAVRIHNSGEAAALAAGINARAFTVGNDIFFAAGEYAPDSAEGRKLLAHELTHVVQQQSGVQRLYRSINPADTPAENSQAQTALQNLSNLRIPPIKQRHLPLYSQLADNGQLGRVRNYTRGRTAQTTVWKQAIQLDESAIQTKLAGLTPAVNWPTSPSNEVIFKLPNHPTDLAFRKSTFLSTTAKIPKWDRSGNYIPEYQVDHIVELQTSGAHGARQAVGNSIENMELLDQPSNSSSGGVIMNGIYGNVNEYLATLSPRPDTAQWLQGHDITFERVTIGAGGNRGEGGSSWWTRDEIQSLTHLDSIRGTPERTYQGDDRNFVLYSGPGGVEVGRFGHARGAANFTPRGRSARSVAGLAIQSITLNTESERDNQQNPETEIGTLAGSWDLPDEWQPADPQTSMPIFGLGAYAGYLIPRAVPTIEFAHASQAVFTELSIGSEGFSAQGNIPTPSVPLLSNMAISLEWLGDDIIFRAEYAPENLNLDFPGLTVYDGAIGLSYSRRRGFGVDGAVYLSVPNLGSGSLMAGFTQQNGINAEGHFDFDSSLFDRASATLWYRNNQFGGEGTLGIDSPDKIRGIRSAELTVGFAENAFNAEGSVQPNIPGVEQAGLTVAYSEAAGLTIGGNLQLTANPAIRSGSIEVTVTKQDAAWKVAATGSAQPAIPGIDSELTVSYDDGAFTAEFSGAFQRGMLAGNATVGVTNRAVDEDGRAGGDPLPDGTLNVYGNGSATLQIAPWLQGTVGITFAPNGEVTVVGEIGLPSAVELLPRKQVERNLFSVGTSIPIVPGIVARIAGGADAVAGFGPGQLDQMNLRIEYNPSHEENTHISGGAHLNVPADAGVRLFVRAGIGLGIPGASATGGLEIGGQLGIAGAAEASVNFDWTPTTGVEINAEGYIHAQPRFVFDISGYVEVEALWITVYEHRWNFASFEYGSDLTFGVRFPIHYQEGQPFDIALSDVQFETPNIDTDALLSGLIDRIA